MADRWLHDFAVSSEDEVPDDELVGVLSAWGVARGDATLERATRAVQRLIARPADAGLLESLGRLWGTLASAGSPESYEAELVMRVSARHLDRLDPDWEPEDEGPAGD